MACPVEGLGVSRGTDLRGGGGGGGGGNIHGQNYFFPLVWSQDFLGEGVYPFMTWSDLFLLWYRARLF